VILLLFLKTLQVRSGVVALSWMHIIGICSC
jgi:hypothetical protein